MRKSIKSFIAVLILILGVFQASAVFAKDNIPSATSDFYVNDFANIFSADEKTRLMDNAVKLSDEHNGIQVVVTTVESLNGDTIENYALNMYNLYGIGKDDMGLLILLSTGDRQIRVEVGKAMEAYITDAKAGRFIDKYAIPSLKENKFDEGLINLQEAVISQIVANIESTENVQTSDSKTNLNFLSILVTIFVIGIIVGIIVLIVIFIRKIIAKGREKQQKIDSLTNQLEASQQNIIQIKNTNKADINKLQGKINDLLEEKEKLNFNYQCLEDKYEKLEDRYKRVQILYPTADKDVTNMIEEEIRQRDIKLAEETDLIIQNVIGLSASKDIVSKLANAISYYSRLNDRQRGYVQSNISKLKQLYNESLHLKEEYDKKVEEERKKKLAASAVSSVVAIISCINFGKSSNLRKLKEAKAIYENLESGARSYFDKSVADRLEELYRQAKRDKEEEEEEERRRRRRREEEEWQSSYSSFGSSSGYDGFGGSSGGGGASRGF